MTGLLVSSGVVLAVHDETFQLEGDASASTQTNVGGHAQTVDWDSIFTAAGVARATLPTGYSDAGFFRDFNTGANGTFSTNDTTTFATGSKDTLPISGWQCNRDNNVNSKIDVMNAYTAAYEAPNGDELVYFALERNTNTGTADVGFWFFQDEVGCVSPGGAVTFDGEHKDGDILVVSEFTNGGRVSTINVYRWDRNNGNPDCDDDPIGPGCVINPPGVPGSLNPTPVGGGVDCRDPNLILPDAACAASNTVSNGTNGTISVLWSTANKADGVGHSLRTSEFYEGGINLTDLGLGGKCFSSFLGDTRSSTSLTATLFDFAGGTVGSCESRTETTPSIGPAGATIPGDPADASITVHDTAAITVDGADTFDASVSFHLCGPTAASSTDLCTTGGVDIGSVAVTTSGNYDSANAVVTSAGRYCWRADFSGDAEAGVPPSSDSRASECFTIAPRKATLTTLAGAGPVTLGQPVTDTATLGNTAHEPGTGGPAGSNGSINPATLGGDATGTITFTLYKDNACSVLATGTGTNPQTRTVAGNGTYGPVSFTPDTPGTYHWVASYGGDLPNTTASDPSACLDENEDVVVVGNAAITSAQRWLPNDRVVVTGPTNLTGSLTITLYPNGTCTGTPVPNQSYPFTLNNTPSGTAFNTGNTTFFVGTKPDGTAGAAAGSYSWLVHYDDSTLNDPQDRCEASNLTITD